MNKHQIEQEHYCLQATMLCDLLRTKLFLIDDFKNYDSVSKKLKKIKQDINEIYWSL